MYCALLFFDIYFPQNLSYGQTKEFNCEDCHSKLSVLVESTRFQYIQPRTNKTGQSSPSLANKGISNRMPLVGSQLHHTVVENLHSAGEWAYK